MDDTFQQRRGLLTINAEIVEDGVRYRERSLFREVEFKVGFAEIDPEAIRVYSVSKLNLVICIFFAFSFVLRAYRVLVTRAISLDGLLIPALLLLLPALGTWMHSARYVGFRTDHGGMMFFESRGKGDPSAFMGRIRRARAAHIQAHFPHLVSDPTPVPQTRAVGFTAGNSIAG